MADAIIKAAQRAAALTRQSSDALGDRAGVIELRARRVTEVDARWDSAVGATIRPPRWSARWRSGSEQGANSGTSDASELSLQT
jgi:hypothetical protein